MVTLRKSSPSPKEYLSIEQVRFGPRLAVSLSVSAEAYEAQVPRFLLQPIVENAIRHGIARCPNGGEVAIRASVVAAQLHIEIENDRSQGTQQAGEKGDGLGLANTRTRLEKLYGATRKRNRLYIARRPVLSLDSVSSDHDELSHEHSRTGGGR